MVPASFDMTDSGHPNILPAQPRRRGFTLVEILIVVSIIIIVLAMALPAFQYINGSKSVDGAQNIIASVIGRARARALGLQQPTGILFFNDPNNGNLTTCILLQSTLTVSTDAPNTVYLDVVPNSDYFPLPPKISAQFLSSSAKYDGTNWECRYVGFNTSPTANPPITTPFGGVVLFDELGRLYPTYYGFRIFDPLTQKVTALGQLLGVPASTTYAAGSTTDYVPPGYQATQFGLILYNNEIFRNLGYFDQPNASHAYSDVFFDPSSSTYFVGTNFTGIPNYNSTSYYGTGKTEAQVEAWIDVNGTPLIINRYNGTLTRAE